MPTVEINMRPVGDGHPTYVVAEVGINHNGNISIARQLIDVAKTAGCDAVKFQKRDPERCVPRQMRSIMRDTPWGVMTYLEYRKRIEFGIQEYTEISNYCKEREITWFASVWDEESVDFLEQFDPPCYKIPSAVLTSHSLLHRVARTRRPTILSTGMSTMEQIRSAVEVFDPGRLLIAHCTSSYPCKPEELNLRVIQTLTKTFNCPVGYSGHDVGLQTTYAAIVLGACFIERHITLDRSLWGSDQAASVEPWGLARLLRDIRVIERSLGDGQKRIYESELAAMKRLRPAK